MNKVYILHESPKIRGNPDEDWDSKYDFSEAEQYGELEFVLSVAEAKKMTVGQLWEAFEIRLLNMDENDYLLMIGSPLVQSIATLVASTIVDKLTILVYTRGNRKYTPYILDVSNIFWSEGNTTRRRR